MHRLKKYVTAALNPTFWPAIMRGVMPTVEHIGPLRSLNARTIIDVGANKGQFSLVARHLFPDAHIYAFEPLETARSRYESVVKAPLRMQALALGEEETSATFFIASRADSSSLLAPGKGQEQAYGVDLSSTMTVSVARLDQVIQPADLRDPVLLKLDVQGAELQVLRGAEKLLPLISAIYCEVSFVELYEQQPTASSIISFLDSLGFKLRGVFNMSTTRQFGPTQADLLFFREVGN
jgi:FkbM family methyltransferase